MVNGGRNLRAFRPSHFSPSDECDEVTERAKAQNMQLYAARVEAGLPLFEPAQVHLAHQAAVAQAHVSS